MKLPVRKLCLSLALIVNFLPGEIRAQPPDPSDPIFHYTIVEKRPELKRSIRPDYPSSIRRRKTPGEITLTFLVGRDGKVSNITVVSFNDADMIDAVYAAYEEARFIPGEHGGKPVRVHMQVTEMFPAKSEPKPDPKPTPTPKPDSKSPTRR